jgi:hypothetical protein
MQILQLERTHDLDHLYCRPTSVHDVMLMSSSIALTGVTVALERDGGFGEFCALPLEILYGTADSRPIPLDGSVCDPVVVFSIVEDVFVFLERR